MKTDFSFMAFASGTVSKEEAEIKRYIGIAPVTIIAVNPSKEELEKLYGREMNEPSYVTEVERNEEMVKSALVNFIVRTDKERTGIDTIDRVSFWIRNEAFYNRDFTKLQVIDKYGRTAWVTKEELDNHIVPTYSNGFKANIDSGYRAAYRGEAELTSFIKTYLNIPDASKYENGHWVPVSNLDECEARLDGIEKFFNGDFTELRELIKFQPNNKLKVLFGVKVTDRGSYSDVYTRMFLHNNSVNYERLRKDVENAKAAGAYANTEFEIVPLKEWKPEVTDLGNVQADKDDLPFEQSNDNEDLPFDI